MKNIHGFLATTCLVLLQHVPVVSGSLAAPALGRGEMIKEGQEGGEGQGVRPASNTHAVVSFANQCSQYPPPPQSMAEERLLYSWYCLEHFLYYYQE